MKPKVFEMMTKDERRLAELKKQLDEVWALMPQNFREQTAKYKVIFEISREIEMIENPKAYQENLNHWEGHEYRA